MIKLRFKNLSYRPKFDDGDILDFVGCKMSTRILLKVVWLRNSHAASVGVMIHFSREFLYNSQNFWRAVHSKGFCKFLLLNKLSYKGDN